MTGENVEVYCGKRRCVTCRRALQREFMRLPKQREYRRIYQEVKRREAGVPDYRHNNRWKNREAPKTPDNQTVPAGPFGEWLCQNAPPEQRPASLAFLNEYRAEPFQRWAKSLGLDGSQARKIMRGQQKTVSFDIVDRALVEAGEPHMLNELYPMEMAA